MLTAYDAMARIVDEAGIDVILVGDSLASVVQGRPNTLGVTMEEMIYHTAIVSAAVKRALVVADMPFLSFQVSPEEAVRNAGRLLKEGGAAAVKLEGGTVVADRIEVIARMDIPVMAHIGLTPQSIHRMGGYRVQGRDAAGAALLRSDAKAVESAGAFAVVLEGVPANLASEITETVGIPTIGIGAGPGCDGQVLVLHDLLGLTADRTPTFVRRYADLRSAALEAIVRYRDDVRERRFPSDKESYG